jgi:hypothetical protein
MPTGTVRRSSVERTARGDEDAGDAEYAAQGLEMAVVVKDAKAALGRCGRDQVVSRW